MRVCTNEHSCTHHTNTHTHTHWHTHTLTHTLCTYINLHQRIRFEWEISKVSKMRQDAHIESNGSRIMKEISHILHQQRVAFTNYYLLSLIHVMISDIETVTCDPTWSGFCTNLHQLIVTNRWRLTRAAIIIKWNYHHHCRLDSFEDRALRHCLKSRRITQRWRISKFKRQKWPETYWEWFQQQKPKSIHYLMFPGGPPP